MTDRSPRRPLRASVLAGLLLAVLTLAAGSAYALTQHATYTAESLLVVLPRTDLDDATSAAYYETMSRGQIVGTFAEVGNNPAFQSEALDQLGIAPAQRADVSTEVSVVPDTSVILVRVTSRSATVAAQAANAIAKLTSADLATLTTAYRTQLVPDDGSATPSSGLTPTLVLVLAGVVAVVLGLALQQAVYHLLAARRLAVATGATTPAGKPGRGAVAVPAAPDQSQDQDELSLAGRA